MHKSFIVLIEKPMPEHKKQPEQTVHNGSRITAEQEPKYEMAQQLTGKKWDKA